MKRNIFTVFAALTALFLASCSMTGTNEIHENGMDAKEAYITIGLNDLARTALPTVSDAEDFDSFTLGRNIPSEPESPGVLLGTFTTDGTGTAYAKLKAKKFSIDAGETYIFTLEATKGGAKWRGTATKTIETGENHLSFTLALYKLTSEGKGSLSITLTVPDMVKAVKAELKTVDESQTLTPENFTLNFADGKATCTAGGIEAGAYVLVYSLYGDSEKTLKLSEWREYAGIADGVTSSSNPVIASNDDLAKIYKITLNLNGGTLNETFPGSYTRCSDMITLPESIHYDSWGFLRHSDNLEIYRKNYIFEGWYDAEIGGNEVGYICKGTTGDITLWARWTDTFTVSVKNCEATSSSYFGDYLENYLVYFQEIGFDKINLKIIDMEDAKEPEDWSSLNWDENLNDWKDERFTAINRAICAAQGEITDAKNEETGHYSFTYTGLGVNLDLSETSLRYIPYYAFSDFMGYSLESKPVNLIGITLPQSLTAIFPYAFSEVGFTEITIPKNVVYLGSSMFTKTQLAAVHFESGSKIETIEEYAFEEAAITAITLPASLSSIGDSAFYDCKDLKSINFLGTKSQWAAVERGEAWHEGITAATVTCSDGVVALDYPIGTKLPSKPKAVGDIVFNDGTAMPYADFTALTDDEKNAKKDYAIALIFYKGTGLNSGDDTTTSRTLGVGLKHNRSGLAWCLNSAAACSTNITTIQCPVSGSAGALTFTGDRNGSDNLKQISDFLISLGETDDTGTAENYPAFYFGKNYKDTATNIAGTDYESGWYLPSIAELFQIYANGKGENKVFDIDAASEALGGDKFGSEYYYYWSSSQSASPDDNNASYDLTLSAGDRGTYSKFGSNDYVCAVRAFN